MNEATAIQPYQQSTGSSVTADKAVELAKMLALVAPITMTSEQQELWLRAAIDGLQDIRSDEIAAVSAEVRRSVTRHAQIVPEVSRLVAERRAHKSRMAEYSQPVNALPPPPRHIADRDRRDFTASDWAELNVWLESQGATNRYRPDGTRYAIT